MRILHSLFLSFSLLFLLPGCSGDASADKTILGTWVQETPTSMTSQGIQTTTANSVLKFEKNSQTKLSRHLDIAGQGLPEAGVSVSLELRGNWELIDNQLSMSPENVIITPRDTAPLTRQWADRLQEQAEQSPTSIKTLISVDSKQLILQDNDTGTTDVYIRK